MTGRSVLAVVALATSLAGCGGCGRADPDAGRAIEVGVATDAETLDPRYATDAVAMRVTRLVHAGLVRLDPDSMEPLPYVAERWAWRDARTLRVELREGVRFHSGAPVRPEDVVATLRAFADPAVGSRHARVVDAIGSAEADGPRAVIIHLSRAHGTLLTDLELPILRADEAASAPRPEGNLDGLGPYAIEGVAHGEIRLSPAKGGVPHEPHRSLVIRTVRDENARALRVHAGRLDVVVNGFSPTLLPALEGAHGVTVKSRVGANLTYLVPRVDRGPLARPELRRALSRAVDRDLVARTLLAARAQSAATLMPPGHWAHADIGPRDARDVEPLRALTRDGPIKISLLTSTDRLRGTIARALAQQLREGGVELEVVPLELGTMMARLAAGDFELAMLQMPELTEPNVLRVFLHESSIPPAGANRGRVRDADVDRLLDEGARQTQAGERRETYAALERLMRERAYVIPLWHEDQVVVASARAGTFLPSAEGRWLGLADLP